MKKILALLLVLLVFATGCAHQTTAPPVEPPEGQELLPPVLPDEREIALRRLTVQGREISALFSDFSDVTDMAWAEGGLRYVSSKVLWSSDLAGRHVPLHREHESNFESWYGEISELHASQRYDSVGPQGNASLSAYRKPVEETYALVLSNPAGAEAILLNGLNELEILGWASDYQLVFYADVGEQGRNAYVTDVWEEAVAFQRSTYDTQYINVAQISDVVSSRAGLMWAYDENRLAYVLGSKVYTVDSVGFSRVVAILGAPLVWAERNIMLTYDEDSGLPPQLYYKGNSMDLSQMGIHMPRAIDWNNERFFYVFKDERGTGVAVIDLPTGEETVLFFAAEGFELTCLALSPEGDEFVFAQVLELDSPDQGPYSDYISEVYRVDMVSGHMLLLEGQGLLTAPMQSYVSSAYWLKDSLLGLGQRFAGDPTSEALLGLQWISPIGVVIQSEQLRQHVKVISQDNRHMFLAESTSDGWDIWRQYRVWHLDVGNEESVRQLTSSNPWQIQQDLALDYNEERELLFISRFKGFEDQNNLRPIVHGVLVDLQGREYTLLSEDIRGIEQAVWIGDDLYIRLPGKIIKATIQ